jgi:AraC family transcriptional regulator
MSLREAARSAPAAGSEPTLAFDAEAVLFELGPIGHQWSYDSLRPQLRFSFDHGHATAAFQDAPARDVACAPGSYLLLTPGMRMRTRHKSPLEILSLTFAPGALAGRAEMDLDDEPPIRTLDPGLWSLAVEARRVLVDETEPDRGYMAALGDAMLARVLQVAEHGAPQRGRVAISPFRLRRLIAHIEDHLDSKITVPELADMAELSAAHFSRAFRQATGEAPHHFILSRRIDRVRQLLRDPELDLTTVAIRAGFSSHAHMSSAFKRLTGLAPAAYRAAVGERMAG